MNNHRIEDKDKDKNQISNLLIIGNGNDMNYFNNRTSYFEFQSNIKNKLDENIEKINTDISCFFSEIKVERIKVLYNAKHFYPVKDLDCIAKLLTDEDYMEEHSSIINMDMLERINLDTNIDKTNLFFYSIITNMFEDKNLEYDDIKWGDIESALGDMYNRMVNKREMDYFIKHFEDWKKYFIEDFLVPIINNKKLVDRDLFEEKMSLCLKNNSSFYTIDFNYTMRYYNIVDNYYAIHGGYIEKNLSKDVVFGANVKLDERLNTLLKKEMRSKVDKKFQKVRLSSVHDFTLDYSNIQNIYSLGFSFSKNDSYFIHALLYKNPDIKFYIISFGDKKDSYALDQLYSLYETIENYPYDPSILERKISNDDFKIILRNPDFRDVLKKN